MFNEREHRKQMSCSVLSKRKYKKQVYCLKRSIQVDMHWTKDILYRYLFDIYYDKYDKVIYISNDEFARSLKFNISSFYDIFSVKRWSSSLAIFSSCVRSDIVEFFLEKYIWFSLRKDISFPVNLVRAATYFLVEKFLSVIYTLIFNTAIEPDLLSNILKWEDGIEVRQGKNDGGFPVIVDMVYGELLQPTYVDSLKELNIDSLRREDLQRVFLPYVVEALFPLEINSNNSFFLDGMNPKHVHALLCLDDLIQYILELYA